MLVSWKSRVIPFCVLILVPVPHNFENMSDYTVPWLHNGVKLCENTLIM